VAAIKESSSPKKGKQTMEMSSPTTKAAPLCPETQKRVVAQQKQQRKSRLEMGSDPL